MCLCEPRQRLRALQIRSFNNMLIFALAESAIFQQRIIQSRRSLILPRQKVRFQWMCCRSTYCTLILSLFLDFPFIVFSPGCLLSQGFVFSDRDVSPLVLPARRTNPGEINHKYGPMSGRSQGGGNRLEYSSWSASNY